MRLKGISIFVVNANLHIFQLNQSLVSQLIVSRFTFIGVTAFAKHELMAL